MPPVDQDHSRVHPCRARLEPHMAPLAPGALRLPSPPNPPSLEFVGRNPSDTCPRSAAMTRVDALAMVGLARSQSLP